MAEQPKPKHKVIIHKVQVEEAPAPATPEPLVEEPVTPGPDQGPQGLKRKEDEPLADAGKKVKVEDVTEDVTAPEDKAVNGQNGDAMSDYVSRRSSVRRAGSSRVEVEGEFRVSGSKGK